MKAIIDINPDADGVRCGECERRTKDNCQWAHGKWRHWVTTLDDGEKNYFAHYRGPKCLAGTQRHQRMVEALQEARSRILGDTCTRTRNDLIVEIDALLADEVKP